MAPAVRHIIPFTTMRRSNDGRSRRHRTLWDAGEASTINPGSQAMITNKQEKMQVRSSSSSESLRLIVAQSAVGQQSCTDHLPLGQRRSRLTKHRSTYTVLGGGPGAGVRLDARKRPVVFLHSNPFGLDEFLNFFAHHYFAGRGLEIGPRGVAW